MELCFEMCIKQDTYPCFTLLEVIRCKYGGLNVCYFVVQMTCVDMHACMHANDGMGDVNDGILNANDGILNANDGMWH